MAWPSTLRTSPYQPIPTKDNEDNSKFTMNQESLDDQLKTSQEDELGVVFSEGEEEGEGERELLNTQMNRQISKVETFLKNDRLRRTKLPNII